MSNKGAHPGQGLDIEKYRLAKYKFGLEWVDEALCQNYDSEIWHVEQQSQTYDSKAKVICSRCPVQPTCLAFAIVAEETQDIWGGATPLERKKIISANKKRDPS